MNESKKKNRRNNSMNESLKIDVKRRKFDFSGIERKIQ